MTKSRSDNTASPAAWDARRPLTLAACLSMFLHGLVFAGFARLHEPRQAEAPQVLTVVFQQLGDTAGASGELDGESKVDLQAKAQEPRGGPQSSSPVSPPPARRQGQGAPAELETQVATQETPADVARPEPTEANPVTAKPLPPRRKPRVPERLTELPSSTASVGEDTGDDPPLSFVEAKESSSSDSPRPSVAVSEKIEPKLETPGVRTAALGSERSLSAGNRNATATAASYTGVGLSNAQPRYPYAARRRGEEGRVVLRVQVTAAGDAADVMVLRTSGFPRLDQAARAAVRNWRFLPASRNGKAVPGIVDVPVTFNLTDG